MEQKIIKIKSITNNKWVNLFKVQYINSKNKITDRIFASRKKDPFNDKNVDVIIIVPIIDTLDGPRLVVIKEYRVIIGGYEYCFPAGLIEPGQKIAEAAKKELKEETGLNIKKFIGSTQSLYSSSGLTDESCVIVFVKAEGEISQKYQEETEEIEPLLYDIKDIKKLLSSEEKIAAKAWGVLYYFSKIGKIDDTTL